MTTKPKRAAKAAKPDTGDNFDQGGPDGASKQRDHNTKKFSGDELIELLETITAAQDRIKKRADEASKKSQPDRETITAAKKDLVDSGYPSTELATIIRRHKLQTQLANIDSKLDDDQKETFAQMVEALGDFGELPLGKAALGKAEKSRGANR